MKQKLFCLTILLYLGYFSSFAQNIHQQFKLNQLLDSALQNNYLLRANQQDKLKLIGQSDIELLKTTYLPKIGGLVMALFLVFIFIPVVYMIFYGKKGLNPKTN